EALVEYVYQCPYCKEKAVVQGYAYPADYERVEYGAFYDKLCCSLCGEVSEVHFSRDIKREVAGEE
ncbi:MAG: hypothetical protein IIZ39_10265, partial [Blautia sp.]|nr:hypothetical protein [Blautia sp.]